MSAPDWSLIPAPADDGAADHLADMTMPSVSLPATDGDHVDLSALRGISVLYIYPRTGRPDQDMPENWDDIPGARGCTPQSCAFRDHFADLQGYGVTALYGISTQDSAYQAEAVARLALPYPLLSDAGGALRAALRLPHFEADGDTLLKRVTLILRDDRIAAVFYPVFPPDEDALNVIDWLKNNA